MDEKEIVGTETGYEDDWSDIDFSDIASDDTEAVEATADTSEETEADHSPEQTEEAKPEAESTETTENAEADQSFEYKYMGEVKHCNREEAITLIQKGADYDRVKEKLADYEQVKTQLEEARTAAQENTQAAEFVKALAADSGMTVSELMETVDASRIAKRDGVSLDEAKTRLRLEKREAAVAAKEKALEEKAKPQQETAAPNEARRKEFADFFKAYPDVKATDIPTEVFKAAAQQGIPLVAAYAKHEIAQAKAALEAEKQNLKNKERSAGSASTSGKAKSMDALDAAWYDGT